MIPILIFGAILRLAAGEQVCCDGLPVCFNDGAPYDHLPLPECQNSVQATFKLYTRRNPQDGVVIATDISVPNVYDGQKRTIFVIHGWQSSGEASWVVDMKDALIGKIDANVILVDWNGGSGTLWYPQAAANVRTTGAMVGVIANKLIKEGRSDVSRQWCMGASLGAHSCGQAGKYVNFKRVTGFDPAGPLFESYDLSTGLNPTSGQYVEAIHTAGRGGLVGFNPGTLKPMGHVDFYPNGGKVQPGCSNFYALQDAINRGEFAKAPDMYGLDGQPFLACSHKRAQAYFIESLKSQDCRFFAWSKCTDSEDIPESCDSCGDSPCNELGIDSETARNHQRKAGLLYLETYGEEPFCQG